MARKRPPATAGLEGKLTKALATCRGCEPQVSYLESLAAVAPEIEQDVARLRIKLEHLRQLATVGLEGIDIDPATVAVD